jgi:hypothetical protein
MKADALPLYMVGGLAVAAALWAVTRKGAAGAAGQAVGSAAVEAAEGVVVGTVEGIGEAVGIPHTADDQCTRDLAAGDLWAASFSCPAPRFIEALASGAYGSAENTGAAEGGW